VADNQPMAPMKQNRENENRAFFEYATRLREFIRQSMNGLVAHDALEQQFSDLAQDLFQLQFEHNQVFRQLCEHRRITPESRPHWKSMPSVAARAFKELEVTCLPEDDRRSVFYTSGTTQEHPGRHFHNPDSLAIYEASLLPWFRRHLLTDKQPISLVNLTPTKVLAPHSSLVAMLDTVAREDGHRGVEFVGCVGSDGAWQIDRPRLHCVLEKAAADSRPVALFGTAFNFVHFLDYCQANRIRYALPSGSRVMETGGYKGRSRMLSKTTLHTLIGRVFGIPVSHLVCEYGMCELSSQAYDAAIPQVQAAWALRDTGATAAPPERIFHFPPWAKAVVVSPETGREVGESDSGLIQVVDLANVWSVLAVQTEDLGIRRGNGFELVGRAVQADPRGCSLNS
jgi:hypothetical protein